MQPFLEGFQWGHIVRYPYPLAASSGWGYS